MARWLGIASITLVAGVLAVSRTHGSRDAELPPWGRDRTPPASPAGPRNKAELGPCSSSIVDSIAVTIPDGETHVVRWDIGWNRSNCLVTGAVTVRSGGSRDVMVLVMSDGDYDRWVAGRRVSLDGEMAVVGSGTVRATTSTRGPYALVISNADSARSPGPKAVELRQFKRVCTW